MSLSNEITNLILDMLNDDGRAEIQRNELAQSIGCVPSQINYVISSRFTPEQGYIVESRRGGGGYIRIRRVTMDPKQMIMHAVNSIGNSIDENTARAFVVNLNNADVLSTQKARMILCAMSDSALKPAPAEVRDAVRASILKHMLITE